MAMGDDVRGGTEFPYRVACDAFFLGSKKTPILDLDDRDWDCVTLLHQTSAASTGAAKFTRGERPHGRSG